MSRATEILEMLSDFNEGMSNVDFKNQVVKEFKDADLVLDFPGKRSGDYVVRVGELFFVKRTSTQDTSGEMMDNFSTDLKGLIKKAKKSKKGYFYYLDKL